MNSSDETDKKSKVIIDSYSNLKENQNTNDDQKNSKVKSENHSYNNSEHISFKNWKTQFDISKSKNDEIKTKEESLSFRKYIPLSSPDHEDENFITNINFPGQFPYTRGIHSSMYYGKMWTMRQFAGFGSPEDTNKRFKFLLSNGQTGLSVAFDMPTLMGYDSDNIRSVGEVGREGVNISSIEDMERLFDDIKLENITVSMTINCTASIILAMYFVVAKRRGIDLNLLKGTIQNDMLKEFIAQKEWICPPSPSLKISCDIIEYCSEKAVKFNPISLSGYHIREAGSTIIQELAFTISDGIQYVESCIQRGMSIDSFAPRLSFFFDVHNEFFEEIAKFRAARRIWARLIKERYNPKLQASLLLRTHAQTAGVSLTAEQPMNNIARVAIQALSAILGGVQSLHTNSMDETLALPTEEAVKVALRTQQIIAEETGVAMTIDPLGGSYFVEKLTDDIEAEALKYIHYIDQIGGMLKAIEIGFPQKEIAESSYKFQQKYEKNEIVIVGMNKYKDSEEFEIPLLHIDPALEKTQIDNLQNFKKLRNNLIVNEKLTLLKKACVENINIFPLVIDAVDIGATLGEVSDVYREVFGIYTEQ